MNIAKWTSAIAKFTLFTVNPIFPGIKGTPHYCPKTTSRIHLGGSDGKRDSIY